MVLIFRNDRNQETRATLSDDECDQILKGSLPAVLSEHVRALSLDKKAEKETA